MRELLPDNLALAERLEALPVCFGQPSKNAEQRAIGSLITWVSSFATYVAIISERVVDMLAYMRLIIREAHKHGGNGWLTYDAVFRRNQQGESKPWNVLDPSLHTAYISGQRSAPRVPCKHCNESDHPPEDCALASLLPATRTPQRDQEERLTPIPRSGRRPPLGLVTPTPKRLCISWNRGQCAFPGACSYKHACALCDCLDHQAKDCALAPPDSFYKQPPRRKQ